MERRTDWHRASWLRCMEIDLPELIGRMAELSTYRIVEKGTVADVELGVLNGSKEVRTVYRDIAMPSETGLFTVFEPPRLVVPLAEYEEISEVRCAGDQLLEFVSARLVDTSPDLLTTERALRSWLPLSEWIASFLLEQGQVLDDRNWVSRETHLRRIKLQNPTDLFVNNKVVCPFETPEGPMIGRVLSLAAGARVEGGRIVASESMPAIGLAASYIPFIDKNDPARLLMGSNMMRQWIEPVEHESALVQTGTEPSAPEFWCGYNLLTAFMAFGRETVEDGIALSASAAARMAYPDRIAVGDKLSNRHGQKGVVSRIVPDEAMPRLPDGTPVDCVVSFIGLHTRQNTGQLWEAAASWLARESGRPYIVEPYRSPDRAELAAQLAAFDSPHRRRLSLPDQIDAGTEDKTESEVLVGWVYWGCTVHRASAKLRAAGADEALQVHGEMEYNAFRNNRLYSYIAETNGAASEEATAAETAGLIAGSWTPFEDGTFETAPLRRMREKLALAGIEVVADSQGVGFRWMPTTAADALPVPLRHPWCSRRTLASIPPNPGNPGRGEIERLARRLRLLLESDAPRSLVDSSTAGLQEAVDTYFASLITHEDVIPRGRRRFTGRAVIVPSSELGVDEVGLPEEMVWTMFAPLVDIDASDLQRRTTAARHALQAELSERLVIVNRAPTLSDTTMIAFRPRMVSHAAVELHPLVCRWMNADYDGDMVAVYLPIASAAVAEVGENLTVVGHLRRNPALIDSLLPTHEALCGIAYRREETAAPTASSVAESVRALLSSKGPEEAIKRIEELFAEGLAAARHSGASFDPLCAPWDGQPPADRAEAAERLSAATGEGRGFETQLLAVKAGARGTLEQLLNLLHSRRVGNRLVTRGQLAGYSEGDHRLLALDVRRQLHALVNGLSSVAGDYNTSQRPPGFTLLARLARAERPGVVIASAAETGERDPLVDIDARLTVGLPVDSRPTEPRSG